MKTARVLIVDDDEIVRRTYSVLLGDQGIRVDEASNLEELTTALRRVAYDVILLDLILEREESGLDALPLVLREQPYAGVFILTSSKSVDQAVECMRRGAAGYLTKDLPHDKLKEEIHRFLDSRKVAPTTSAALPFAADVIGESPTVQALKARIERIKDIDSTVLILGESGTGKEVIARFLHSISGRREEPFCAVNCGAIPEALLESELFGHKKGAFTDARADKKGLFEVAGAGTVLLDEIGDMPLVLQTKILRVLQERQFTPVGAHTVVPLKARILCATHRHLAQEVAEGRFREDLYFRINVLILNTPPLRERRTDLPILVAHFLAQCNRRFGRQVAAPSRDLLQKISAYPWPGNVRELQNSLERAVALSPDDELHEEDIFYHITAGRTGASAVRLPTRIPEPADERQRDSPPADIDLDQSLDDARAAFERQYLAYHLKKADGNISEVARAIGRYRADVYRMLEKSGLSAETYRNRESEKETPGE